MIKLDRLPSIKLYIGLKRQIYFCVLLQINWYIDNWKKVSNYGALICKLVSQTFTTVERLFWMDTQHLWCLWFDTKLHLMMRILFWRVYCTNLLPLLPVPLWLVRVSSMGKIDLLNSYSYLLEPCAKKKTKPK